MEAPGDERALELAFRYVNRRERTVAEVRAYLAGKAIAERKIEETIDALTETGALDDARYARVFAQDKRELEQWGSDRIARGLRERGVDSELVEAATAAEDSAAERDRALTVLSRRFPRPPSDRRELERALGMLLRKGYGNETALAAIQTYAHAAVSEG